MPGNKVGLKSINSGTMLIIPSARTIDAMIDNIKRTEFNTAERVGDQEYFRALLLDPDWQDTNRSRWATAVASLALSVEPPS